MVSHYFTHNLINNFFFLLWCFFCWIKRRRKKGKPKWWFQDQTICTKSFYTYTNWKLNLFSWKADWFKIQKYHRCCSIERNLIFVLKLFLLINNLWTQPPFSPHPPSFYNYLFYQSSDLLHLLTKLKKNHFCALRFFFRLKDLKRPFHLIRMLKKSLEYINLKWPE